MSHAKIRTTPKGPKIRIERIPLDRGGYTKQGRYYGVGAPMFHAYDDETGGNDYSDTFRAKDREAAKTHVRQRFPKARF